MKEKLGFGHLGNGITFWDSSRRVAHIDYDRKVTYREEVSLEAKLKIERFARYENMSVSQTQQDVFALRPIDYSSFMSKAEKDDFLRDYGCSAAGVEPFIQGMWDDTKSPMENLELFRQWWTGGKAEAPELNDVFFHIEADYNGGRMDPEQHDALYTELRALFSDAGFLIEERDGGCPDVTKGKTRLYCHPESLSGATVKEHVALVEEILKHGKSFRYLRTDIYDRVFDFTPEEESAYYKGKETEIRQTLLRTFDTEGRDMFIYRTEILELVASKFRIRTLRNQSCPDCITQVVGAIRQVYDKLLKEGRIEEASIKVGNSTGIGARVKY